MPPLESLRQVYARLRDQAMASGWSLERLSSGHRRAAAAGSGSARAVAATASHLPPPPQRSTGRRGAWPSAPAPPRAPAPSPPPAASRLARRRRRDRRLRPPPRARPAARAATGSGRGLRGAARCRRRPTRRRCAAADARAEHAPGGRLPTGAPARDAAGASCWRPRASSRKQQLQDAPREHRRSKERLGSVSSVQEGTLVSEAPALRSRSCP